MIYRFLLPISIASAVPAASGAVPAVDVAVTSDITFASEYVFRGIEFADRSFQPTVEVAADDFYAGIWANLPIEQQESELNYYGGYTFELPQVPLAFDARVTVYHFPDTGSRRTHELFLGASAEDVAVPGLSAALYFFYDIDLHTQVVEGSLGYEWALNRLGLRETSLAASVHGGLQGQDKMKAESYNYYGASLELIHALAEGAALTAGAHYATADKLTFDEGLRGKNLFWTLSLTTTF